MALDVTITLTDEREAELVKLTDEHNKTLAAPPVSPILTPLQKARNILREFLDLSAQQRADREAQNTLRLGAVYKVASAEDKATIDTIRAKYTI